MTTPYKFQLETVQRTKELKGRILIGLPMGCGKSFISLLYANQNPELKPIIIVCPATLKWNWQREAAHHLGQRAVVLEGTKPERNGFYSANLIIINYDILKPWMPYLKALKPKLVIIDESQYCGDRRTIRTRMVRELCQGISQVIALSGTPLTNRPAELWPTLNILRPDLFPSFFPYAIKFCGAKKNFYGWDFKGASNLDELHKILTKVMHRKRKEEILHELPAKQRIVIPLDLSSRKEYKKAVKDFIGWLTEINPLKAYTAKRAEKLVKLGYLKRLAARLKLNSVMEWIDDFLAENEEKIVIFAVHKKIIEKLKERYDNVSVVVDGEVVGKQRQLAIDKFLQDKKTRILIGNIKAAGVGWSAKGVSNVAFVELPWAPGTLLQAEDRASGIGRGQAGVALSCFYLIAKETIEQNLLELLEKKQKHLNQILDGKGKGENLDIVEQLAKELENETLESSSLPKIKGRI